MNITTKTATIFGGTGFAGRYIVRELAREGYIVKVATRIPERAYFLRPYGSVGQIVPVLCAYNDPASIEAAVKGSDVVVNCVGILYERRRGDFQRIHTDLVKTIAEACARSGVTRLVHLSALAVERAQSRYAKTKLAGEKAIFAAFPNATILRPSVMFGEEDRFINLFATMAKFLPVLPLIGGGKTKFQPVYVGDVAHAVMAALTLPAQGSDNPQGGIYELAGPETLTFREIYERIFEWTGTRRCLIPLPFPLASLQAAFLQWIPPKPLLTPDQVTGLKTDNVMGADALGLDALGLVPTGMTLIVPPYLERFRKGGRFSTTKTA